MQAYEGYLENGQFFPLGKNINIAGRHKVIITVLDEQKSSKKPKSLSNNEYLAILDEFCGSIDDPTFVEPMEII